MVVTSASSSSFSLHRFLLPSFKCCELKMQTFTKNARIIWQDATKKRGTAKIRAHFLGFYDELIHEMMTKKLCDDVCLQLRALIKNCFLSSLQSKFEVSLALPGFILLSLFDHQSKRTRFFGS